MASMKRLTATAVFVVALSAALDAGGAARTTSGTLNLDKTMRSTRAATPCPPGGNESSTCFRYEAEASIRGLGRLTTSYVKVITLGDPDCEVLLQNPVLFEVAGKGSFAASTIKRECWRFVLPTTVGPFELRVTAGSGSYDRASGSLSFRSTVFNTPPGSSDSWTGVLTVPGFEFDLIPPVLRGARSRTVRVPRKARRARVRFSVTAMDAVDGPVLAVCTRRSGSYFRLGRTKVTCGATDSSENSAARSFTVTVKRRR